MKPNRRSLKIKSGTSAVDAKLNGRVEKAQSFAKSVIFSLFLLVSIGIYARWDTLMELRNASFETSPVPVSVNDNEINADADIINAGANKKTRLRNNKISKYAENVENFKSQIQEKQKLTLNNKDGGDSKPLPKGPVTSQSLILSEEEKVQMNHPKKETYSSLTSKIKDINKATIAQLRHDVGNFKKDLPLESISRDTATKTQMTTEPTQNKQMVLLTGAATVTASVQGNLGPPSVVITPFVSDWLKDRWQAAKDMTGAAIPGPHWLQIDLPRPALSLSRVVIDYEVALSTDYSIDIYCKSTGNWQTVHDTRVADDKLTHREKKDKMHIIHDITIKDVSCPSIDKIKLKIRRPATRFGTSIWRFEAYGVSKMQ